MKELFDNLNNLNNYTNKYEDCVPDKDEDKDENNGSTSQGGKYFTGFSAVDAILKEKIGLAHAYVPFQNDFSTMPIKESLINGTTFADLVGVYDNVSSFTDLK